MHTYLVGMGTGLSLIVAIGAQNAFVLRQGLLRSHVFAVGLFCALSDAILVSLGVFAAGTLTNEYLAPMAAFERNYPHVAFVYMTGHVDIWDDADNKAACAAIRAWCATNDRILYDFNDVEHHDPDGTYYDFVNDDCSVYAGAGGA